MRVIAGLALLVPVMSLSTNRRIVVVGGGAAGFFSAIECASIFKKRGVVCDVLLLEAGKETLSKVLISGGGRCNVMHDPFKGSTEISKGYPRGRRELLGPFNKQFGPWNTYEWFTKKAGVVLKIEGDGRVFPTSDRSATIKAALEKAAADTGMIRVECGAVVSTVSVDDASGGGFVVEYSSRDGDNISYNSDSSAEESPGSAVTLPTIRPKKMHRVSCERVLLATGSSRVGYNILEALGHTIVPPLPSLFSFKIKDEYLTELSGLSMPSCDASIVLPKDYTKGPHKGLLRDGSGGSGLKEKLTQRGPLLITHQGLSGPAVLRLSAFGAKVLASLAYRFKVVISWLPSDKVTEEMLASHLMNEKSRHPTRLVGRGFPPMPASFFRSEEDEWMENIEEYIAPTDEGDGLGERTVNQAAAVADTAIGSIPRRLWLMLLRRVQCPALSQVQQAASKSRPKDENISSSRAITDGEAQEQQGHVEKPLVSATGAPKLSSVAELKWSTLSKKDIEHIAKEIMQCSFEVTGRGMYRDEFVTCGGVSSTEVEFNSMQSKLLPGLFLAGELLDVDGVTGGYNFQSAWTTGWIAGHHCALSLLPEEQGDFAST